MLFRSFAVAVETAVLLFVLAGHKRISYGFAIATALTNLSYYSMMGVPLLSLQAAPAWLMSLLLPAAIVGYSHIIAENRSSVDVPLDDLQTPVATPSATTGHVSTEHTDHANQDTTPVQPVATGAGDTPVPATKPRERTVRKSAQRGKPSAAQRRAQIASAGLDSATAVVAQFGVSLRTAQLDLEQIRKATTQTNGVHA